MVYDSDSTHLFCFRFKLIKNVHVIRMETDMNLIQYEIKALCPHALGTKSRLN